MVGEKIPSFLEKDPKKKKRVFFFFFNLIELKAVSKTFMFEVLHQIAISSNLESGFRQF